MVSTYLSYNLVNRDIKASLNRTESDPVVARQTEYFKENISKVTTLEEFLDDYQLYSYAMKAHGLEEMTYAKAFMKKVLESDLSDENSFANQLTDERYKVAGYNFINPVTGAPTLGLEGVLNAYYGDPRTFSFIVGIEQVKKLRVIGRQFWPKLMQNHSFKKPAGVPQVPLGRACVSHGLHALVFI